MGNTMKLKPILLIVPFLCALCVLFLVDQLYLTPLAQAATQRQRSGQSATTGEIGTAGMADGAPLVLSLAIGRTGSLQEGGGEPIYKTTEGKGKPVAILQYNCAVLVKEDAMTSDWVCVDLPGDKYNGVGYVKASAVERKQLTIGSTDRPALRPVWGLLGDRPGLLELYQPHLRLERHCNTGYSQCPTEHRAADEGSGGAAGGSDLLSGERGIWPCGHVPGRWVNDQLLRVCWEALSPGRRAYLSPAIQGTGVIRDV